MCLHFNSASPHYRQHSLWPWWCIYGIVPYPIGCWRATVLMRQPFCLCNLSSLTNILQILHLQKQILAKHNYTTHKPSHTCWYRTQKKNIQHHSKTQGHTASFVCCLGNQAACVCPTDIWQETDRCRSVSTSSFTSPMQTPSGHHAKCSVWPHGCREVSCLLIRQTGTQCPSPALQTLEVRTSLEVTKWTRQGRWKSRQSTK